MLTVRHAGEVVAEVPAAFARRRRARSTTGRGARRRGRRGDDPTFMPVRGRPPRALVAVLASPNVACKRWVFEQYDSLVQGQTVASAGSRRRGRPRAGHDEGPRAVDATARAASVTSTRTWARCTPSPKPRATSRPRARRPLAITNCMNFGNPERPVVMWQFAESIRGMRDACLALETPVTGGNVSFYNESGRLGDLADAGDRHARGARRLPAACPDGLPAGAGSRSTCWGRPSRSSAGRSSRSRCSEWWRAGPRRSISSASGRSSASSSRPRRATCSRAPTTAPTGGSRSPWRNRAIEGGHGFAVTIPATSRRTSRCSASRHPARSWRAPPEHVEALEELAAARGVPCATARGDRRSPGRRSTA